MRKVAFIGVVSALVLVVPLVVFGATGSGSSALDEQQFRFRDTPVSKSTTTWTNVPGLAPIDLCAVNQVTFTMSVTLQGAPAGFRVRIDGVEDPTAFAHPGAIRLTPGSSGNGFTFQFVRSVGPFEANDLHRFDLQWRSPTGNTTTINRGVVTAQYERGGLGPACELPG